MVDLKTYLTAAAMWDLSNVNLTRAAEEFAAHVYGSPAAAAGVLGYKYAMQASFNTHDKGLDYKGYRGKGGAAKVITIRNAVYDNRTLLTCGQVLNDADVAGPSKWHKDNVRQVQMTVQFVVLMRWAQLRLRAAGSNVTWPFAASAAEEFGLFNATLTRLNVYEVTTMVEYPITATYQCDLLCLRVLMLRR
jgi:hypothetical protein